jgi:DNA-directed RNA polymerase subunit RPC12/RpoP
MGYWKGSGVDAYEADVVWDCRECEEENEESIMTEGDYAWVKCRHCGHEQEIEVV